MFTKDAWYLKRWLYPFYAFILFTLAFPHGNLWPLAWICLVPYFLFIDGEKNWCKLIFLPSIAYAIPMIYCYFGFFYFSHNDYLIFVIFMMIWGLKIFNTICPRCEKPYFFNNWVKWWVNHCVHCGLYIKADKE